MNKKRWKKKDLNDLGNDQREPLFNQDKKTKRSLSPLYLGIISGIILVILILNGLLEIHRTRNGFYLLLEREGINLIQHVERNIQEAFSSLQWMESGPGEPPSIFSRSGVFYNLEDSVAQYLLNAIYRTDQIDSIKPLIPLELKSLADQYHITSIEIYDVRGNILKHSPAPYTPDEKKLLLRELIEKKHSVAIDLFGKPLSENNHFSIALWRRMTPGIIVLSLNGEQMEKLLQRFALQKTIAEVGLRGGVLYVMIQDPSLNTIAQTGLTFVDKKEDDLFLNNSFLLNGALSRHLTPVKGEEIFEVVKPFSFRNQTMGLIRIGYSSKEIYPVLSHIKKNVALSIFYFLILGGSAVTLILVNQNRHLKKMKELEDRVRVAERLSSLGHLAAGVAHEIRNPLNAMGMGLQRLKREFLPPDESKKEEYISFVELILKEIRRVNEIIEQFLTLSRPFQLNPKTSSLQDLLKNLMTLFQEEASSLGIILQAEISPELPLIRLDPERLTQALINIMKNGMQAMGQGGILHIEAKPSKEAVLILISDSGSGIPPEEMEKVFNYYYTTKENGVGLGLPIAHRIIEAHGGRLNIESQVGAGTKVTVTLPI